MSTQNFSGTGGEILVDALRRHGTRQAFCVPGESYLAALDAFVDEPSIELIVCRQESGASMMAGATGRLTGQPGICFVTRGPGATNASAGVHIAWQDGQPMILFIGQVARHEAETDAFQEVDFRQMFGPMAKWIGQIESPSRIPEYVSRAFHVATSGRPGPVVVALPEDMLTETTTCTPVPAYARTEAAPSDSQLQALTTALGDSERPVAIVGGVGWNQSSSDNFARFAEKFDIPVCTAFRCQDHFDNTHRNYAGECGTAISPSMRERIDEADLLLLVGVRVAHLTSPFQSLIGVPTTKQKFVHVHPGPEELGALTRPDIAINASSAEFAAAAARLDAPKQLDRSAWRMAANDDYIAWNAPVSSPGNVQLATIMRSLSDELAADAVFTVGAGNYTMWVHRFVQSRCFGSFVGPMSGSMGFSTPAAIAAKLAHPSRTVVAVTGDGCFMMTSQELATAIHHDLAIIWVVINNSMYGTIRMHQERDYPERISATSLTNPNFAMLAEAHGALGFVVERTEEFAPAFAAALESKRAALIEIRVDQDLISTTTTLSEIRSRASSR